MDFERLLYFTLEYLKTFGICSLCEYCESITVDEIAYCKLRGKVELMLKCNYFKYKESRKQEEINR